MEMKIKKEYTHTPTESPLHYTRATKLYLNWKKKKKKDF